MLRIRLMIKFNPVISYCHRILSRFSRFTTQSDYYRSQCRSNSFFCFDCSAQSMPMNEGKSIGDIC
jgi:hypothetical protein